MFKALRRKKSNCLVNRASNTRDGTPNIQPSKPRTIHPTTLSAESRWFSYLNQCCIRISHAEIGSSVFVPYHRQWLQGRWWGICSVPWELVEPKSQPGDENEMATAMHYRGTEILQTWYLLPFWKQCEQWMSWTKQRRRYLGITYGRNGTKADLKSCERHGICNAISWQPSWILWS